MPSSSRPPIYCNPLPLPDFQRGVNKRTDPGGETAWIRPHLRPEERDDFREMADPTVIFWQGRWYLFPSRGMLWHSDDLVHWEFQRIGPFHVSDGRVLEEIGYAPTVVEWRGKLLLTACWTGNLWQADHPFGPWENLGPIRDEKGELFNWNDPMLFADDDGSLYCYHGLGPDGIYAVRMREDDPTRFAAPQQHCFPFDPTHKWEWFGANNQDPTKSYIEGAWMVKREGQYYLTYSGPATQFKTYAMGCYRSDSPLGPWHYQESSPFLVHKGGLVNGCGHGSITQGPDGSWWCFYTVAVCIEHRFERRIGMDPVTFAPNGDICCAGPSETPQYGPGGPAGLTNPGWENLSAGGLASASSSAPGRDPMYAVDDTIKTWWEASAPAPQWLCVDLDTEGKAPLVCAARLLFADRGLNYADGALPGPYRYRVEGSTDGTEWFVLEDQGANTIDRHIAFHVFAESRPARFVRVVVEEAPPGLRIGLWEFTVFGSWS